MHPLLTGGKGGVGEGVRQGIHIIRVIFREKRTNHLKRLLAVLGSHWQMRKLTYLTGNVIRIGKPPSSQTDQIILFV